MNYESDAPELHAHWLNYQSSAQAHWFAGLYQQGYRNQTPEQRNLGIGFRNTAHIANRFAQETSALYAQHLSASNAAKYAGPFSNWEDGNAS